MSGAVSASMREESYFATPATQLRCLATAMDSSPKGRSTARSGSVSSMAVAHWTRLQSSHARALPVIILLCAKPTARLEADGKSLAIKPSNHQTFDQNLAFCDVQDSTVSCIATGLKHSEVNQEILRCSVVLEFVFCQVLRLEE